jgi:signal transduction histidine kinase
MTDTREPSESQNPDSDGLARSIAVSGLQVSQAVDELQQAAERLLSAEERARETETRWRTAEEQLAQGASKNAELLEMLQTAREAQTEAEEHTRRAEQTLADARQASVEAQERAGRAEQELEQARQTQAHTEEQLGTARAEAQQLIDRTQAQAEEQLGRARAQAEEQLGRARAEAEERAARAEQELEHARRAQAEAEERAGRAGEPLEQARVAQAEAEERAQRAEQRLQIAVERARLMEEQIKDLDSKVSEAEARPQVTVIVDDERTALQEAVAADVRRPLTSILGLTLALKHADPQSPDGSDMIRQLATNARKLDRLVGEMLALDQIANGVFEPNLRRTDIEALVRRVVEEAPDLANRDVKIEAEHVAIQVDPALAEQMVETLLSNAGRRTAPGSPVWVKISSDQGGAVIAVDDTGPEVPPGLRGAMVAALADEGPGARRTHGATGLTLLARLAEIHGGRAWVEERPGGGASFRVFLPNGREPRQESQRDSADDRAAARVLDSSDERAVALAKALVGDAGGGPEKQAEEFEAGPTSKRGRRARREEARGGVVR